ncbi:uncharacterized protein LOC133815262 [Humulus lupulus]|uniref:uncharacterized protein LOC133815262 n=1 Tax=Humulus lupulus TaxID=3486 RepID=UPI002B40E10B|nr:uncharacterized protein LOC133815262 [Humulus lupulus]
MAAYHTRSNSLPSRQQHPLIPEFDQQLCRLRSSGAASSSSSSSVASKLSGLQDLHDYLDRFLLLPLNQRALSREQNEKCVDEILEGSLRLLEVCNTAKDALLQIKESTQELQSIMRRRRSGEMNLSSEIKKYLGSRKVVKKALFKAMENRCNFRSLNKDQETVEVVNMMREVESITLTIFESLISFMSGPKSSKSSGWSLVSKIINTKRVACEDIIISNESNEFVSADAALNMLISQKLKKSDIMIEDTAQKELQKLELCIQDLEEGVESHYRRLIKTRVSLLNILSH